jgi:ribosomal protein S18 acetylase RimI-like enzyme
MISHHRIRLAARADAHAISALSAVAIEHGLLQSWTPQRVLGSMGNPATNVAVAREGGRLAGFGIMDYGDTHAHLALFAVAEAGRRRGLGTSLLEWLEKCAMTAGIEAVRAEVRLDNAIARAFYRARGYREGLRLSGYYQGVEDALALEKRLRA